MFRICDRGTYDIRIFCVNNNRTKDILLPLVRNKVYAYPLRIVNNYDENDNNPGTRIFYDCFASYQEWILTIMDIYTIK